MASQVVARSTVGPQGRGPSFFAPIERRLGLTLTGALLVVVAIIAWILGNIYGGRAAYLLAYVGVLTLVAAVVMARRRRPVKAERSSISRRARVGQSLDVELAISATSRVTTFRLSEKLHPHLGPSVIAPVPAVGPENPITHRYSFTPWLRGVYKVGPLTAEFTDPFGLAKRNQHLLDEVEIIIHPNTDEVLDRPLTRAFEDPPLRPPRSRPWPEGFEFYGMRDYVPGDDMRRIVWRAFMRTERLLVREFEQGISDRIAVVVDTDEEWHSRGVPSDTFETAVRVAASVGVRHIKDGFSVRLESNYGQLGRVFRGPKSRLPFLDELARIHLDKEPLHNAMDRLARSGRRDDHVVLVTSNFDSESAARAKLFLSEGASLTVCAIVWEEADPNSLRRADEVGAQVVQVKPGAPLTGVFRASLERHGK